MEVGLDGLMELTESPRFHEAPRQEFPDGSGVPACDLRPKAQEGRPDPICIGRVGEAEVAWGRTERLKR